MGVRVCAAADVGRITVRTEHSAPAAEDTDTQRDADLGANNWVNVPPTGCLAD